MRLVRTIAPAALVAALLALSGCALPSVLGADPSALTNADAGRRLDQAQKKAGSYTYDITATLDGQPLKGHGVVDLSGAHRVSKGRVSYPGRRGVTQFVERGGRTYVRDVTIGRGWRVLSARGPQSQSIRLILALAGPKASRTDITDVVSVVTGPERTVDGVHTRSYTLSLRKAARPGSAENAYVAGLTAAVDDHDLVRSANGTLEQEGHHIVWKATYSGFGDTVRVTTPHGARLLR